MSSRAIRRAQREREKLAASAQDHNADASSEDDVPYPSNKGASAFELLNQVDDGTDELDAAEESEREPAVEGEGEEEERAQRGTTTAKRKRKKKKKKKRKDGGSSSAAKGASGKVDEIEAALRALSMSRAKTDAEHSTNETTQTRHEQQTVFDALAIDLSHLHLRNEMKRLFGDIAFDDRGGSHEGRDRAQPGDQISLADAVKGVNATGGAGLPSVIRRRNIFIQGKEEWPKASGGGLSMEMERTQADGSILFRFVHNETYRRAQMEFFACVRSMDPTLMVNLLRFNPYHISTLLQVSEIAKQERDHATAGDLLERALFSFGRALHPQFSTAIAQGRARLDFRRSENREFFLAGWRYIQNVSMRATWRTAYEWARLVYQMDPVNDPYAVLYMMDQVALRARQPELFLRLYHCQSLISQGAISLRIPSLQFSSVLAQHMLNGSDGETELGKVMSHYPWMAARLFQTLEIVPIPPSIWGQTPPTDKANLQSELYARQASDLWKTAEGTALLKGAASRVKKEELQATDDEDITVREARYVLLFEQAELIRLMPSSITSSLTSASDPLPPSDDTGSYAGLDSSGQNVGEDLVEEAGNASDELD